MSRRYGRNQRRRARERIAELELEATNLRQSHAMDRALLAQAGERNRALAEIIDLVREELPNHPLLPLDRRELDFSRMADELRAGGSVRVPLSRPTPSRIPVGGPASAIKMDTEVLFAEMVALLDSTDFSALRGQMHLGVRLGREEAAYVISTHALTSMSPEHLEAALTPRIARAMAKSLIEGWRGRERSRHGW